MTPSLPHPPLQPTVPTVPSAQLAPPAATPLARLPLQIGTTATWSAARAAVALFPGLAFLGGAVYCVINAVQKDVPPIAAVMLTAMVALPGVMLTVYAVTHLIAAVKTRASDLLLYPDGILVDGGYLHGHRIGWRELQPPFAQIEDTSARRLTLWRIFLFFVTLLLTKGRRIYSPVEPVRIWRLHVWQAGQKRLVAETERPIERDSMAAAAASMQAVVQGQRYVEQAPVIAQQILVCHACGGPAVPDDAPAVTCAYCRTAIPMPPQLRQQAAGVKAMAQSRETTAKMIAKLRDQPRATRSNGWLLVFTLLMFAAWPVGWGIIAYRVLGDGFQLLDALFLALPLAAVLGGFFLARGRLADRGALQMLTLGFGALAPRRDGEPSRCRRCQGPLPHAGTGGVAPCAYCGAENIIGLDLRPGLDPARTDQHTFDAALKTRAKEKLLWAVLTGVAVIALLGWAAGTAFYIVGQDDDAPAKPAKVVPTPPVAPAPRAPAAPPATPAPRSPAKPPAHR